MTSARSCPSISARLLRRRGTTDFTQVPSALPPPVPVQIYKIIVRRPLKALSTGRYLLAYDIIVAIRLAFVLDDGRALRTHKKRDGNDTRKQLRRSCVNGPNSDHAALGKPSEDIFLVRTLLGHRREFIDHIGDARVLRGTACHVCLDSK